MRRPAPVPTPRLLTVELRDQAFDVTLAVAGEVDDRLARRSVLREILHQPLGHHLRRAERDQHRVERRALDIVGADETREAEIVLDDSLRKLSHRHLPRIPESTPADEPGS